MHPRFAALAVVTNDLHTLHGKVLDLIEASTSDPFPKYHGELVRDLAGLEYQLAQFSELLAGMLPAPGA